MLSDYAKLIKESITMADICDKYGISVNRNHKAICPFHSDSNPSMHIYPGKRGYFCFVCGSHGDVVSFVQKYFQITFSEALKRIDSDFGLNLGISNPLSADEIAQRNRIFYRKRKQEEVLKLKHRSLENAYYAALDRVIGIEREILNDVPEIESEDFSEPFYKALTDLPQARIDLENAEMNLVDFERKHRNS